MKHMRRLICMALMIATVLSLSVSAFAAEYTFESTSDSEYYPSTSYEDIYGSYNYGGINVVDYQIPELSYGCFSTTQTGVMEKVRLPGLQQYVNVSTSAGGYGVGAGSYGTPVISSGTTITPVYREPAYTSAEDMERKDGSIGTLKIPSLDINMKVWEGETNASMAKGLGHYTTTSAWDGNVAVCGHNRGAKYVIGDIKDLEIGDKIMLEELPEYKQLRKCSVFDYEPEWKSREEAERQRRAPEKRSDMEETESPPNLQQSTRNPDAHGAARQAADPPVAGKPSVPQRQETGNTCIYDIPSMKNATPESIGLVEMTRSAIISSDDPELEEMDDPSRIPPGRGI